MKQETKKNDILKKNDLELVFCCQSFGWWHISRAPQRFPFVQCSFLSTSGQDSNKTHHWINLGNSETEPWAFGLLGSQGVSGQSKDLEPKMFIKSDFFFIGPCFFFRRKKMGFIGNKLTKAKHVFCLTSWWFMRFIDLWNVWKIFIKKNGVNNQWINLWNQVRLWHIYIYYI